MYLVNLNILKMGTKGVTIGLKTQLGGSFGGKAGGPGPGHYQANNGLFKNVSYSFGVKTGSALESGKNKAVPGPGSYNVTGDLVNKFNSSSFGS